MHARATLVALASAGMLVSGLAATPAYSSFAQAKRTAPVTAHQMPFPCGQAWTGTTRARHSPSSQAIDWNRADDLGAPVVASWSGVVTTAKKTTSGGYGRYVVIDHGNNEDSLYAHLQSVTVAVGQRVDQGEMIGRLGGSGNVTGPHLHFEERRARKVLAPYLAGKKFTFGTMPTSRNCVDVPLAWFGSKKAGVAVYRRAARSTFLIHREGKAPKVLTFGTGTDEPLVGNWDGKAGANVGVFTPTTGTFKLRTPAGTRSIKFGNANDKAIAGDWDGDGKWEVGAWRPNKAKFRFRAANGKVTTATFGSPGDLPVTGDWDGDGITDIGVHDPATGTFSLRLVDDDGTVWQATIAFGARGDLPVTGDWDGNGRTDLGVWSPSTGKFTLRIASAPTARTARALRTVRFGRIR